MSKILIIEDEEAIADLEKDYLELSGFEVEIANRGDVGLEKALKEEYDLIILDLMLPEVDGFDICRQVRQEKNIPIIIPYAYPGQEEENAHYLVTSGMALQIDSVRDLSSVMDFLIENKYIINHMKELMSEESSKHSIQKSVELSEELIAEHKAD